MIDHELRNNWHLVDTTGTGIIYDDKGIKFNAISGNTATIYHMTDVTCGTELILKLNAKQTGGKTVVQFKNVDNVILEEYHIIKNGKHNIKCIVPNKEIYRNSIIKIYIGSPVGATTTSDIFNVQLESDYTKAPPLECYSRFRFSLDNNGITALSTSTKANSNIYSVTWNETDTCVDVTFVNVNSLFYKPFLIAQQSVTSISELGEPLLVKSGEYNATTNIMKIYLQDITTKLLVKPSVKMWFSCILI